ncbi:cyclic nucleotide-binding domain-containing protein [bacterium]|nr:cyclic nucleotide-binding domain-containing protein [bacterium]MBU1993854.1 cyclic nucleotide-binding domain-containing protein [bacterium]
MIQKNASSLMSDMLGALAGSAVILPQSMGLGVVLFSVMGLDASSGALAGIVGAALLSLISGIFGATIGMLSAPNGPLTMLLVGVFSLMAAEGATSQIMLLTLSAILMLTGIFQILFSLLGGAKLVKYIPYPVIVGLITGIGFLMIQSQLKFVTVSYENIESVWIASIPLIVAAVTILSIVITSRLNKKIPSALAGLFFGVLAYQFFEYFYLHGAYGSWVVGAIPGMDSLHFGFSLEMLQTLNIKVILAASLALTVLATTDCLVTAIVADSQTNLRHNGRKEIIAQGIGQIAAGFFGALGGGGTKGATLVNLQSGGGRYSNIFSGLIFILLVLFFGQLGAYLPVCVLAGVIMFVGFNMIDLNIIRWFKYKKSRTDAMIALIVIGTIIFIDLVTAVGIGVLISMLMYIRMQIIAPIIHRQTDALHKHSLMKRTDEEKEVLQKHGENIVMFELRGNLFFATADKLFEILDPYIQKDFYVILHFQRVALLDISGVMLLLQVASQMKNMGGELLLCHMHKELGLGRKINTALENLDNKHSIKIRTFVDTDSAFEYAENELLQKHDIVLRNKELFIQMEANLLCRNIPAYIVEVIESLCLRKEIQKGDAVFEQGDEGNSLFMVLQGEVEIRLYSSEDEYKHLAKYGAGTYFGEISFLNPGKRIASAVANCDTLVLELEQKSLVALEGNYKEELALALLFELGSTLGNELRYSAQEIRRLEES